MQERDILRKYKPKEVIRNVVLKLNCFGFQRAYDELLRIWSRTNDRTLRRQAAWYLALWHCDRLEAGSTEVVSQYLASAKEGLKDKHALCRVAIVEAEMLTAEGQYVQAQSVIERALSYGVGHTDLALGLANVTRETAAKFAVINDVYRRYGLGEICLLTCERGGLYDQLSTAKSPGIADSKPNGTTSGPLVSVIIPTFNAELVIGTTLRSLREQTWRNLEIIVVDDSSTDSTLEVVARYAECDSRIRVVKNMRNMGPYVARNLGLKAARGVYVTCHDADDWSHAQKIESQVSFLRRRPNLIGCTSMQARSTESLTFVRRGQQGNYVFPNVSSFMFRRRPVVDMFGGWHEVRFGADTELMRRIRRTLGDASIGNLGTPPLSFQRQHEASLTGHAELGYHGYFTGARWEYRDAQEFAHDVSATLHQHSAAYNKCLAVPAVMRPVRRDAKRHFKVIIATDFRSPGGTTHSALQEIIAQRRSGLRTGLVHLPRYDLNPERRVHPLIRREVDGANVEMLAYGENVTCDLLIVRFPGILQDLTSYVPNIEPKHVKIIANQTPLKSYGEEAKRYYDLITCDQNARKLFRCTPTWHPIGPLVREAIETHHADEARAVQWSTQDWVNIIDVAEWDRGKISKLKARIRIGRHARDSEVKWPETKEKLLAVYPESDPFDIYVLGGAEVPRRIIGNIPKNWHVREFGEVSPSQFLKNIDFFVYFTHSNWVESFGRVILEAMAAGVPAVLPYNFRPLFGEYALYCGAEDVSERILEIAACSRKYARYCMSGQQFVLRRFGYDAHLERIRPFVES